MQYEHSAVMYLCLNFITLYRLCLGGLLSLTYTRVLGRHFRDTLAFTVHFRCDHVCPCRPLNVAEQTHIWIYSCPLYNEGERGALMFRQYHGL